MVRKKRVKDVKKDKKSMFDEEIDKYNTYEEYLDSLVSEEDHKYLQDEEMARAIAELGYRYVFTPSVLYPFWPHLYLPSLVHKVPIFPILNY